MKLNTSTPLTVIYRCSLQDTAVLVGLAQIRANIGLIAFTSDLTPESKKYCELLSRWLTNRGLPSISIHPTLTGKELDRVLICPLKDWNWREKECTAAIKFADLPLPPDIHAA